MSKFTEEEILILADRGSINIGDHRVENFFDIYILEACRNNEITLVKENTNILGAFPTGYNSPASIFYFLEVPTIKVLTTGRLEKFFVERLKLVDQ